MSTDRIRLSGLRARGHHGVFAHEKENGQDFLVDVVLHTDTRAAAGSDDLRDTLDYGTLADAVVEIVQGPSLDLIETLAERIADHCLTLCAHVEVTVHKPQAPIAHAFDDVEVHIERFRAAAAPVPTAAPGDLAAPGGAQAVIALGANLGHPVTALREAVSALDRHPRIAVTGTSRIYRTAPVGHTDQPDFLNAVVTVATSISPVELLSVCQGIEVAAGRTRELHWGPRTLDLDLVRYVPAGTDLDEPAAEVRLTGEVLTLPHPLAHERAFVLGPWADVRPEARVACGDEILPIREAVDRAADSEGIRPTELSLT